MLDEINKTITELTTEVIKLRNELEQQENAVKITKDKLKQITEVHLPRLMDNAEMKVIKTSKGISLKLNDKLKINIAKKDQDKRINQFKALIKYGLQDIVKTTISYNFGAGDSKEEKKLLKCLSDNNWKEYNLDKTVHTGQCQSALRNRLENGKEVDINLFGYIQRKVEVKE